MLYKPTYKSPVPESAIITTKKGARLATWTARSGQKRQAEVKVDSEGNTFILVPTSTWYARYTDSAGRRVQRNTGCTDKSAAQAVFSKWQATTEKVKAGIIRQADEHADRRGPVTLDDVLSQYLASIRQAGRTEKHVLYIKHAVEALRDSGRIHRMIDVTRRVIEIYLAGLQDDGKGARTRNMHKALINGFCVYAVRHGFIEANPCANMESANQETDRRHIRRALTDAEVLLLLKTSEKRPLINFMEKNKGPVTKIKDSTIAKYAAIGRERALTYKTLLTTAARWSELKAVTVRDCVLDGNAPHIVLRATATKNRRADTVPLTRELASELKTWIRDSGRIGKARLFNMPASGLRPLKADLEFAKIDYETEDGIVDIHSLRHTAATRLARNGVPVSIAQRILRHSDPKLTMSLYSHLGVLDTTAAVDALPSLSEPLPEKEAENT